VQHIANDVDAGRGQAAAEPEELLIVEAGVFKADLGFTST